MTTIIKFKMIQNLIKYLISLKIEIVNTLIIKVNK